MWRPLISSRSAPSLQTYQAFWYIPPTTSSSLLQSTIKTCCIRSYCSGSPLHSSSILMSVSAGPGVSSSQEGTVTKHNTHAAARSFRAKRDSEEKIAHSEANPWKSWDHMSHKWMILMCFGCLAAGAAAGRVAQINEEALNTPKFDKDKICEQIQKSFINRPDLAPTCIRVAFVLAARRSGVQALEIGESCAIATGLRDVGGVMKFSSIGNGCTTEDIVALAAIEAIRFMKGPCDKIQWTWGRGDSAKPPARLVKKGTSATDTAAAVDGATRPDTSGISATPKNANSSACPIPAGDSMILPIDIILKAIQKDFTVPEMVALIGGAHSCGETHDHVTGLGEKQRSTNRYKLSNEYFKVILKNEKKMVPIVVPRSKENEDILKLPTDICVTTISTSDYADMSGSKNKIQNKRIECAFSQRELDVMLKNKEWRKHVELFAQDEQEWAKNFQSGFQKIIDGNVNGILRIYTGAGKPSIPLDRSVSASATSGV